jgi:dihydroxy-acid dehydratase
MGAKTFKSSKPPSRPVTEQAARVPHRSCVTAMARAGGDDERLIVASAQCAQLALGAGGASRAGRRARTGKTSRQNLKNVKFNIDQKVVYLVSDPISAVGGAVGRQGWLAPEGAIAKVAEMTELPFPEPGWAFAGGKDLQAVAKRRGGVLCINIGIACQRQKSGRLKGGRGKASVARRLDLDVCKADVVGWREAWKAPVAPHQSGVLRTYADQVEPARKGAVSHAGGRTKVVCDAEI